MALAAKAARSGSGRAWPRLAWRSRREAGETRRERAWHRLSAALAVVILALAVLTVVVAADHGPPVAAGRRQHAAARAYPGHPAATPSSLGPLQLVTGSHLVNGIDTGYPHSLAGAVSAAVEFITELGSTLDPDRAATVARLIASPSYTAAPQDAAAQAIAARRKLGLPASGPVPPGQDALLVPVMYQLHDISPDQLSVLLLFDYTQATATDVFSRVGVTEVRLGWTPASWRLLSPPVPASSGTAAGPDLSALIAAPGTARAAARGWKAMTDAL